MAKYLLLLIIVIVAATSYLVVSKSKDLYQVLPINVPATEVPTPAEKVDVSAPSGEPTYVNWHEFSAPDGAFKVMFPVLPQHAAENIADSKTKEVRTYNMYVAEKNDGTIFMITTITFPQERDPKSTETLLTKAMNDMVESNPKNKLKNMKVNNYQDMKALDFSIENDEISIDGKAFMVHDTLYVLTSLGKNGHYNQREFAFFANSFQLNKNHVHMNTSTK